MTKDELLAMPADDYMGPVQLRFFSELILKLVEGLRSNIVEKRPELLRLESHPDPADTASGEELRQRIAGEIQRDSQRINALSGALGRINAQDSYGFCEQSGAPIGLARLLVLPEALLCVDEQERLETRGRHLRSA